MHICFFGASVSEQTSHHETKEITGYVNYFSSVLTSDSDLTTSRVTSGSNSIDDAGIVYVHCVVDLQPDVCVLDWATPAIDDCNQESIDFIYSELLSNQIIPLTVIFPRTDRNQSITPITNKLRNFCQNYSLPFVDLTQLIEPSELSVILRDTVHTTPEGAKRYANLLWKEIKQVNLAKTIFEEFSSKQKSFFVTKVSPQGNIKNQTTGITINIDSNRNYGKIKFFLEQRVGPWTSFIDIYIDQYIHKKHTTCLYDAWCWRERQCLKQMTEWIDLPVNNIKLTQSKKKPNYGHNQDKCNFDSHPKHIRPKGDLFMVSTIEDIKASVVY